MSNPGPIVHRNVTLLQVESASLLEEIRALVDLGSFVVAVIDATTLVIDPARTGELAQVLSDAGLDPLVQKIRSGPPVDIQEDIGEADTVRMEASPRYSPPSSSSSST